jgi:hypothetical protein
MTMFGPSSSNRRPHRTALILSSLALSMLLPGCMAAPTRLGFLTPPIDPTTIVCTDAPKTPLPTTASNADVANRIIDIDQAGENCRQMVNRVHDKIEAFDSIVDQVNEQNHVKPAKVTTK